MSQNEKKDTAMMKTYSARFTGRKVGVIGVFHEIETQVFAPDDKAARLALYDHFEHVTGLMLKEIESPFSAENLAERAKNDASTHDEIVRHVRAIQHVIDRVADRAAKENAVWHDDEDAPEHGLYHSHAEQQYPPSMRLVAAAECALYYMRETPAGLEAFNQLCLAEERSAVR